MRELILVVDDEPCVLNAVCGILRHAGYEVLPASTPDEALRIAAGTRDPIHLLLTDVVMPGMSGPSLAEKFARLHPEAHPVFMAGMPDNPEICERVLGRGKAFLPKPFVASTLVAKVRRVLSSATGQLVA